jgi:hypothetical protein
MGAERKCLFNYSYHPGLAVGGANMQKSVLVYLIIAAMTSAVVAQVNKAEKPATPKLELTVRTDQQTYRMSEKIRMETQLLNAGNEDVYIWNWDLCWNPARGLSMYLTTPDGSSVHGDFLFDCVPPPPKEGNVYDFIKLEPGRFYGVADEIKVTDVASKPGEYDVNVTYNSFASRSFIKEFLRHDPISKLPVWTMEQPTITAPRVHIVIKP